MDYREDNKKSSYILLTLISRSFYNNNGSAYKKTVQVLGVLYVVIMGFYTGGLPIITYSKEGFGCISKRHVGNKNKKIRDRNPQYHENITMN